MPRPKIRLYVPEVYAAGAQLALSPSQSHYLVNVMRAQAGDVVAVFNGHDGEWEALVSLPDKKRTTLELKTQRAAHTASADIWLCFAPIKNKTDIVVEKATELGVSKIMAVFMRHSVVKSVNEEKLVAHAIEAAEQCERLTIPTLETCKDIPHMLAHWPNDRMLLFADESGDGTPLKELLPKLPVGKYAVLIGPEGGFSIEEQQMLKQQPFVKTCSLGPRILRADTAAVSALACVQAWLGDWDRKIPSP